MLAGAPVTPRTSDAQRPAPGGAAPRGAAAGGATAGGATAGGATEVATAADRGTPYVLGERRSLHSRVMGERRELIVFTPRSYSAGTDRYPVLYVLDGAENALIAATAARELAASSRVPEMIVVCVVNTDRGRDFTPALHQTRELPPGIERAGGADRFLRFVGEELVPFIDARFRTRPLRTIVGHSLGGLLAMHALSTRPALFRRYITVDPSLWWDAGAMLDQVRDSLARRAETVARVAGVKGDSAEFAQMFGVASAGAIAGVRAGVRVTLVPLEGEAHEYLMYRGLYAGLIAVFADYYPAMRHDAGQATMVALDAQYSALSREFGYDVPIPMSNLLEVANREANQRRFIRARAALDRAAALYPASRTPAEWRAQVAELEADAVRLGQNEVTSRIRPTVQPPSVLEPLKGSWQLRITSTSPSFMPSSATVVMAVSGDTLFAQTTHAGMAFDGGEYREPRAPVEVRGDTLRWDRENAGGGREITTVVRAPDGSFSGRADLVDGHPLPAGFTPPEIRIELRRRAPSVRP